MHTFGCNGTEVSTDQNRTAKHPSFAQKRNCAAKVAAICMAFCMVAPLFGCQESRESESGEPEQSRSEIISSADESVQSAESSDYGEEEALDYVCNVSKSDYFEDKTLHTDATDLYYLFHEPMRKSKKPAPLIIFLHGLGDTVNTLYFGTADPFVTALVELENSSIEFSAYTIVPETPFFQ